MKGDIFEAWIMQLNNQFKRPKLKDDYDFG